MKIGEHPFYKPIIIGAGPAGCAASYALSKSKIPHILLDKKEFPRDKTCGDGLVLYAFNVMRMHQPKMLEDLQNQEWYLPSYSGRFYASNSNLVDIEISKKTSHDIAPIGFCKRIHLDAFLHKYLNHNYCHLVTNENIQSIKKSEHQYLIELEKGKTLSTPLLLAADGVQSMAIRSLNLKESKSIKHTTFISGYFENLQMLLPNNSAEIRYLFRNCPMFFYIFPLGNNSANVSLGVSANHLAKHKLNLKKEIQSIIAEHSSLSKNFKTAKQVGAWRGWTVPYSSLKHKKYGPNYLLLGDAAGLANPLYKEGVGTAMMSGWTAGLVAADAISHSDFSAKQLSKYQKQLKKQMLPLRAYSYAALHLANHPRLFDATIHLLKPWIRKYVHNTVNKQVYNPIPFTLFLIWCLS